MARDYGIGPEFVIGPEELILGNRFRHHSIGTAQQQLEQLGFALRQVQRSGADRDLT